MLFCRFFICLYDLSNYHNTQFTLTLKRLGGGLKGPPRQISRPFRRAKFSDCANRQLFTFKSCTSFETTFMKIGHTVTTLLDFLYLCMSHQKLLKNMILCTISMQIVLLAQFHKCMIIFTFTD